MRFPAPLLSRFGLLKPAAFVLFAIASLNTQPLIAQICNTGSMYISGNMYAEGDFTNESTASYQNNGNFYLKNNFVNNQSGMAEGTGTTSFIGTTLQWISGAQSPLFHDVYYSNAAGVKMNLNTSIGGTISPVAGSLYFNDYQLTMGGKMDAAYTNTAAFNVTALSNLVITGDGLTTANGLYFDAAANTLYNLTVSAAGKAKLGNALNITAGSNFGSVVVDGQFTSNGFLTLKSDANGTAVVGNSAGTISGDVTVERYIPARRAWRFLSVPFYSSSQTIRDAWQEGVNNTDLVYANNKNPNPGYGTHITGNNNTSLGYDLNTTTNPSLKTWDAVNQAWSAAAPATNSTNIKGYDAYCIFVRGSRAVNLSWASSAPADVTTLRIKGVLNESGVYSNNTVTKTVSSVSGGSVLFSNPFASPINVLNVLGNAKSAKVNKVQFAVWDPKLAGLYSVGAYVTYSSGVWAPAGGSYAASDLPIVQSGQAFMVTATGTSPKLAFLQSNKVTSPQNNVFGAQANTLPVPVIYTNLLAVSGVIRDLSDGVAAAFGSTYSEGKDDYDASKLWNFGENIALMRNDEAYAIEFRPIPKKTDTLFYKLYLRKQPYVLQIFSANVPADLNGQAWLIDKYLGTENEVNLYDTTLYNFTPNTDTNSYRNRFMLVFERTKTGRPAIIDTLIAKIKARIYPNPVIGKTFTLAIEEGVKGNYTVNIFTTGGKLVATRKLSYGSGQNSYTIKVPATITTGKYVVQILNSEGIAVSSIPLVIVQ